MNNSYSYNDYKLKLEFCGNATTPSPRLKHS